MIVAPQHHSKRTSSKLFLDFVPVQYLIAFFVQVVSLIVVEPVVENLAWNWVLGVLVLVSELALFVLAHPLVFRVKVHVVDIVIILHFISLVVAHAAAVVHQDF